MMCLMIYDDLEGAKYLWRRAGDTLRDNSLSSFANTFCIAKHLMNGSIEKAIDVIDCVAWEEQLSFTASHLRAILVRRRWESVAKWYTHISIPELALSLRMPSETVKLG